MKPFGLMFLLALGLVPTQTAWAADLNREVPSWLEAQTNVQSWSADFVQTRSLKSLTKPLKASGHVWFAAPNKFRWELGTPPQTIAVRGTDQMQVIYPRLKRIERFNLSGNAAGPWKDALALLEAGFPRSAEELRAQYNILDQQQEGSRVRLTLQPKSAAARRMMPQIKIEFDSKDYLLRATELEFADGSSMRNDFSNAVINPPVSQDMFSPPVPPDYTVVEPLKK
ncbi:MAG TPA: outer membrane lipoprotein carrier protein LolA [Verrucomicrobiae bacterium]|nr:outer membrane lipoprotein carrier protein LolA [Verrucomicrobiae bacterium]